MSKPGRIHEPQEDRPRRQQQPARTPKRIKGTSRAAKATGKTTGTDAEGCREESRSEYGYGAGSRTEMGEGRRGKYIYICIYSFFLHLVQSSVAWCTVKTRPSLTGKLQTEIPQGLVLLHRLRATRTDVQCNTRKVKPQARERTRRHAPSTSTLASCTAPGAQANVGPGTHGSGTKELGKSSACGAGARRCRSGRPGRTPDQNP